jgi:TonB family protein
MKIETKAKRTGMMNKTVKVFLILLIISGILNVIFLTYIFQLRKYGYNKEQHESEIGGEDVDLMMNPLRREKEALEIVKGEDGSEIDTVPYVEVEVRPKPVSIPKAQWPKGVRGEFCNIVIKALVDIDGSIIEARIFKTCGYQKLEEAALVAAKKAKFTPAQHQGKFVRVWLIFPIKFAL